MFSWTAWSRARKAKELAKEEVLLEEAVRSITRNWKDPLGHRRKRIEAQEAERARPMTEQGSFPNIIILDGIHAVSARATGESSGPVTAIKMCAAMMLGRDPVQNIVEKIRKTADALKEATGESMLVVIADVPELIEYAMALRDLDIQVTEVFRSFMSRRNPESTVMAEALAAYREAHGKGADYEHSLCLAFAESVRMPRIEPLESMTWGREPEQEAAPQVLGTYKDGNTAHMGDVVAGPVALMVVTGYTKGEPRRLLCEWSAFDASGVRPYSKDFDPGELTMIRRAPEPAVPAEPAQDRAYVCNVGGVAVPFGLRGKQPSRAPKVTPADVEAAIASEHYYTGKEGMHGWMSRQAASGCFVDVHVPRALDGVMHCTLVAHNGSLFTGEAFCADLDNPDLDRAREAARRRAFDKLYDAVVYAARERAHQAAQPNVPMQSSGYHVNPRTVFDRLGEEGGVSTWKPVSGASGVI